MNQWRIEEVQGQLMALGVADACQLVSKDFQESFAWYPEGLEKARATALPGLSDLTEAHGLEFLVFLGTWCGDTHEQLPELMAILIASGVSLEKIQLVGLSRDKTLAGYTDRYLIRKLPTFVVLQAGKEIGRITETPVKTLAEDLTEILKGASRE